MDMNPTWRHAEGGLERIAVQGGWIYRDPAGGGLCFVPAPATGAQTVRPLRDVKAEAAAA